MRLPWITASVLSILLAAAAVLDALSGHGSSAALHAAWCVVTLVPIAFGLLVVTRRRGPPDRLAAARRRRRARADRVRRRVRALRRARPPGHAARGRVGGRAHRPRLAAAVRRRDRDRLGVPRRPAALPALAAAGRSRAALSLRRPDRVHACWRTSRSATPFGAVPPAAARVPMSVIGVPLARLRARLPRRPRRRCPRGAVPAPPRFRDRAPATAVARLRRRAGPRSRWRSASLEVAVTGDDGPIALVGGIFALTAVPAGVGVAILRYRLYEIDRLINRTLVYAVLTAALAAVFAAISLGVGVAVGSGSTLATAAATLTVALLFGPLRARVQRLVDRRFDRARYAGLQTVQRFLEELRAGRAAPEATGAMLAEALGDPALELRFRLDGRRRGRRGGPRDRGPGPPGRMRTPVRRGGLALATVVHDPVARPSGPTCSTARSARPGWRSRSRGCASRCGASLPRSRRRAPASSPRATRSAAGSSATSTTARSSGSSRSAWRCATSSTSCRTPRRSMPSWPRSRARSRSCASWPAACGRRASTTGSATRCASWRRGRG